MRKEVRRVIQMSRKIDNKIEDIKIYLAYSTSILDEFQVQLSMSCKTLVSLSVYMTNKETQCPIHYLLLVIHLYALTCHKNRDPNSHGPIRYPFVLVIRHIR